MRPASRPARILLIAGLAALALEYARASSPEQDTLVTAQRLKPISDEEWSQVAGPRLSEKYQIIPGDTLFDVSKRLFGDARYWPKLYALNNDTILNPHVIRPGNSVSFQPGTGTSLPAVAVESASGGAEPRTLARAPRDKSSSRSSEWKHLPRQAWESTSLFPPPHVDRLGMDMSSRISFSKPHGYELETMAATERLPFIGQIVGSRSSGEYLGLGDTVYIRADEDVQLGETYAITQEPAILKSRKSDRVGLSYPILGKVKIIGVRDNLFVGSVTTSRGFIYRGTSIIANPARIPELTPVAAPAATEGVIIVDKSFSTYATAQHKVVYIDRGAEDGVKRGMVFRAYAHYDPSNEKRITTSDFIIDADLLVLHASERFCTAIVMTSLSPIMENASAVLLTDVSDIGSHKGFREKTLGDPNGQGDELDELDKLDGGGDLGKDEQKELEQLERWKGNPEAPAAPAAPGAPADDLALPPPPEGESAETVPPPPAPEDGDLPPPPPSEGESLLTAPPAPDDGPPPAPELESAPSAANEAPPAPEPGAPAASPSDESQALDRLLSD